MKILGRIVAALVLLYATIFSIVLGAMCQTPERFGRFMRYAPAPVVFGLLPAKQMWLWARGGHLRVGEPAPDFSLPLQNGTGIVRLSDFRGKRPVVLIFGSYT